MCRLLVTSFTSGIRRIINLIIIDLYTSRSRRGRRCRDPRLPQHDATTTPSPLRRKPLEFQGRTNVCVHSYNNLYCIGSGGFFSGGTRARTAMLRPAGADRDGDPHSPPIIKCRQMGSRLTVSQGEDRDRSGCGNTHLLARTFPEVFPVSGRTAPIEASTKSCEECRWKPRRGSVTTLPDVSVGVALTKKHALRAVGRRALAMERR